MNVKLEWSSNFLGICTYEDKIYPNKFFVELKMVTTTDNPQHQNIAFERMKLIVTEVFAHSIFVSHESPILATLATIYPEKMVVLPEEAFDQVIALALYCKLNAVMENKIKCENIRISSEFGDNVWYQFKAGEELGPFSAVVKRTSRKKPATPWWHRSDVLTFDTDTKLETASWEDLDLSWEVNELANPGEIIDIKKKRPRRKFQAEVIDGGLKDADK